MHTAVWKVGGSLFDLPDFVPRLSRLLTDATDQRVLLVPGGGWLSRSVREWQRRTEMDDEDAHWLAVGAMDFNAQLLAAALPRGEVVQTPVQASGCWQRGWIPVLSPTTWLMQQEREQFALPPTWAVTSDSIAAWIAARWSFDELVLLKSRSLESGVSVVTAAERGWVDSYFPQVARDVPLIGWCNLRDASPRILPWLSREKEETQGSPSLGF